MPQPNAENTDPTFNEEQAHLSEIYAEIIKVRDELQHRLDTTHKEAAQDLRDMSEEVRLDFGGADETMETLAAVETLNSVIDAYNQAHDFDVDRLRRALLLMNQPYFAKVRLEMRPGRPARDVYIGATGLTDQNRRPLIVDWRSPVAETYYNQQMGPTSYKVNGKTRRVNLQLRRQFDITRDKLNSYFDTTVAIQDSLLLDTLKKHHSPKLQAITATIQREQNEVVRHEDVPVLLVAGIAGSGKTSVLLQRIAYLFYQERETLSADQIFLFTPNDVFKRYIDTVLPSLGESNPQTYTWREFMQSLGFGERNAGADTNPDVLLGMDQKLASLELEEADFRDIRVDDVVLVHASQVDAAFRKFPRVPMGPRRAALVKEDLHDKLDRKIAQLAKSDSLQEDMLGLDLEQQVQVFGEPISPANEDETAKLALTYARHRFAGAHDQIEQATWLRVDRVGMRLTGKNALNALEASYLRLIITGNDAREVRYVMVDEVQDYSVAQLMLMARYFSRAHFLLLGDPNQAIRENTATFPQMQEVFQRTHGAVQKCELLTSYRSSPEITALFTSLMPADGRAHTNSVREAGVAPRVESIEDTDAYLAKLRSIVDEAAQKNELTAIVAQSRSRVMWLKKQLGDSVQVQTGDGNLPSRGVILLDLPLAKGLEFDHVIIPDAQEDVYPDTPLSHRRLYTALSRAMHEVTVLAQGPLTPLLKPHRDANNT